MTPRVAIAHDYLTQRGGAERVALVMARAFPGAPLYTSLYEPDGTYPEVRDLDVHPSFLQAVGPLRRHHRLGLPLFPLAFGRLRPDADVVLASSSGWAHGIGGDAAQVTYCYTPARWLYRPDQLAPGALARAGMRVLGPPLRRWDQRQARASDRYLTTSHAIATLIASTYGIEAEVLPPPPGLGAHGDQDPVPGLEPGFVLCVARLLPYKHVELVVAAMASVGDRPLVIVGDGPRREAVVTATDRLGPGRVHHVLRPTDAELRWLYAHAGVLATAAEEDYGLTPVEAGSFGVPTVARAAGGHLETVLDGRTGLLVSEPTPATFGAALRDALDHRWDATAIAAQAATRDEPTFIARLHAVVAEVG